MSSLYGTMGNISTATGTGGGGTGGLGAGPAAGLGNKIPKGYGLGRLQQFTPEQLRLFQSLFSQIGPESFLSQIAGGSPEAFAELERPALQQFTGELGNIASKFSGFGMGARRSSGFGHEATGAASDFAQKLQAQRMGLQRQALGDLFSMSNMLLGQRPYEQFLAEKPDFLSQLLGTGGQLAEMFAKIAPFFI
jgi:hypothetical protein